MAKKKEKIRFIKTHPDNERSQSNLKIFSILKEQKTLPISSISEKAEITANAAADYVNLCTGRGLVDVSTAPSSRERLVGFSNNKKVVGIGFSGKKCLLSVMDIGGEIIKKKSFAIEAQLESKLKNKEITAILGKLKKEPDFAAGAFSLAGLAIPRQMAELNPKQVGILAEDINAFLGCDVLITKTPTAAGYAEREFVPKTKLKDVLYLYMDVGDGVVIKGDTIFEANDEKGNRAYLRPWNQFSIAHMAKDMVSKGVGTNIVDMASGDVNRITLDIVLKAAEKKDELAMDLVRRAGLALGVRAAYLINMFKTNVIVLGGGTEKKEGGFGEFVRESAQKFLIREMSKKLEIVSGMLGEEAPSIGAALLSRRELFMEV